MTSVQASSSNPALAIAYREHDDLSYDLGLLSAFDTHPLDPATLASPGGLEAALAQAASEASQLLLRRVWSLPISKTEAGPVVTLPSRSTRLPRAQPPPAKAPLTRWEKFAKSKGIVKTKRSSKVFDETVDDFKHRWGKDRVNKDGAKDWLLPVKELPGGGHGINARGVRNKRAGVQEDFMERGEDEFSRRDLAKRDRVLKNEISQLKNMQRATAATAAAGGAASRAEATLARLTAPPAAGGKGGKRARGGGEGEEAPAPKKRVLQFEGGGGLAAGAGAQALQAPRVRHVEAPASSRGGRRPPASSRGAADDAGGVPLGVPLIERSRGEGALDAPLRSMVKAAVGSGAGSAARLKESSGTKIARLKLAQGATASMGKVRGGAGGREGWGLALRKMSRPGWRAARGCWGCACMRERRRTHNGPHALSPSPTSPPPV